MRFFQIEVASHPWVEWFWWDIVRFLPNEGQKRTSSFFYNLTDEMSVFRLISPHAILIRSHGLDGFITFLQSLYMSWDLVGSRWQMNANKWPERASARARERERYFVCRPEGVATPNELRHGTSNGAPTDFLTILWPVFEHSGFIWRSLVRWGTKLSNYTY